MCAAGTSSYSGAALRCSALLEQHKNISIVIVIVPNGSRIRKRYLELDIVHDAYLVPGMPILEKRRNTA